MNSLAWMTKEKRAKYDRFKKEQEKINKEKANSKGKGQDKRKGRGTDQENSGLSPGQCAQRLKKSGFNVFCFQASGSKQFLLALVRQPSFFKAEGLEKLCSEWAKIKTSDEYQQAVEQSKKRTKEQTEQKAELQKLRIQINRLRRQREDTKDLLRRLKDKENSYGRRKQQRPPGAYLATNRT